MQLENFFPCPCCLELTLGEAGAYEVCPNCNWEDDPVQQDDPMYAGGANKLSLLEARERYRIQLTKRPLAE